MRLKWEEQGIHVPPFLIVSITNRCNLRCKGCYAQALHHSETEELDMLQYRKLFQEARELGVSEILLAGGEPLMRKEILGITKDFPEIIFPLFTNGYFLDDELVGVLKRQRQTIPVISIEGPQETTDERRGEGTYKKIFETMERLKKAGIFFGASLTLTRENFEDIASGGFIDKLAQAGGKLFFLIDYIPVKEGSEELVLRPEQRIRLKTILAAWNRRYPAIFISFPGDEEDFGGCLAAGRGFVHVSPDGALEPCPFAPYSDVNFKESSLKEGLRSPFLASIRENHHLLSETSGGCALWEKREWVKTLIRY